MILGGAVGELVRAEIVDAEIVETVPATLPTRYETQAARDRTIKNADEVFKRIRGALAPNTVDAYYARWHHYLMWCQRPENSRTPVPASLETLLSYLNDCARDRLSPSTIRIALSALKRVHSWGNPPPSWEGGHQQVTDWVKKYRRECAADPERQPKRATGARKVIMKAMLDAIPADAPYALRDRAVLLLGYYMAARRSELVNLHRRDVRMTVDGLEVHIAYSKTDQIGEGKTVAVPGNDAHPQYDPQAAVQDYLGYLDGEGVTDGPLLRHIDKHGHLGKGLTGQAIDWIVKRAAGHAYTAAEARYAAARKRKDTTEAKAQKLLMTLISPGNVRLSPHSLRRGFATDARFSAWDLLDIARHGRWSPQSGSLHIYIEEADRWLRHQTKPVLL
jgi:integrase